MSWREFCSLVRREGAEGKAGIGAQFKTRTRKTDECGTRSALCATRPKVFPRRRGRVYTPGQI